MAIATGAASTVAKTIASFPKGFCVSVQSALKFAFNEPTNCEDHVSAVTRS